MSHYRDGTKAELGDLVRGRGYNLKHEVLGVVVGISPGQGACDIHVATLRPMRGTGTEPCVYPATYEEHGTCAAFELIECSPLHPGRPAAPPLPSDGDLARDAFEAYNASTGGLTHDKKPIPPFDAIAENTPHIVRAWEAACAAVRKRLGR